MKRYRVLTEWVGLTKTYKPGEEVELPPHEAEIFLGWVLEPVVESEPVEVESEPVEVEPAKPAKKKATA